MDIVTLIAELERWQERAINAEDLALSTLKLFDHYRERALKAEARVRELEAPKRTYERPKKINDCEKCGGSGWVWWQQLKHYNGPAADPHDCYSDDTKYDCDECDGKPKEEPKHEPLLGWPFNPHVLDDVDIG